MGLAFGIALAAILSKFYDNIVIEVSFVFTSCYLVKKLIRFSLKLNPSKL